MHVFIFGGPFPVSIGGKNNTILGNICDKGHNWRLSIPQLGGIWKIKNISVMRWLSDYIHPKFGGFMKHILRLVNYCKNTITSTQPTFLPWCFGLYQRPSSEEVCSIPLPVLATIVMRCGKKLVVRLAQRVAPLVPVQRLPSLFSNMYCLFESNKSTRWIRGSTYLKRRTAIFEPGRGQLHAEPHVRPLSCHVASLSWQEPEEELNKLLLIKVSDRDRNVQVKMLVVLN